MSLRGFDAQKVAETCEPLVEAKVQSLGSSELLTLLEEAVVTSINIDITNTRFETTANENVEMLRKEVLRRMAAFRE